MMMVITLLDLFRALRRHGATFALTPDGKVDIMLPMGTTLPADLDAALVEHQGEIGNLALAVDLKEPRTWTPAAALAETREMFDRIDVSFLNLPEPGRQRADIDARPVVDAAMALIVHAFEHNSMQVLRLALLEAEGRVIEAIAGAERQHRN